MPAAMTVPATEHIDDTDITRITASGRAGEAEAETPGADLPAEDRPTTDLPAADLPMSPAAFAALAVAQRLEALLREEIASLRGASITSLKQMNHRKSQCLLEFSRAARALGDEPAPPALAAALDRLKQVVVDNQATLSTHIVAVRDIAGLIAEAMQAHESDGTYADRPAPRAPLGGEATGEVPARSAAGEKGVAP
ncbi:MAG: hypothetical protein JJU21_11845 [Salinarimonas sp.]|nr:hypothetical protein [Salinarimonas sp.]